jgi:serine/threonine protein kinase/tetratricopeptide (TPR) repeat protein
VFRVRDLRTGAVCAAKVLKTEHRTPGSSWSSATKEEIVSRFEDEFRILRTLHHPHLPEVFDYGCTHDGARFLVMELVDGQPLGAYFRAHPSDIWVILYELCETLVFVHARNLLHQDIKPSNILVSRAAVADGERPVIKLIDFGLTYRRHVGAAVRMVGTAAYIAPEIARGDRSPTRAVDYYSLGATLFELLTGAPPFVGTENEVLRAHIEREPIIENEELEWSELYPHVRGLLAKDPQKRLAAFEEFRRVVVGRLTGGIDDLDRSYALARIDSLGMIGKNDAWNKLVNWLDTSVTGTQSADAHTFSISGVEGVGKRFLTSSLRAEAALRGVRTLSPAEIGWTQRDDAAARQPAMMWSRLLEVCEKESVVLVVDRPMSLPDEERSFVRLAGTQWELYRSRGRVLPLFFLLAIDSTSEDADTLDYLPSDGAIKLELPALNRIDCEQIVEQFRGAMFDPRDARALTTYLERFDNSGAAIQALQRAVLRGGLTFLGQRWKVQPGLLTEIVESRSGDSFSRELVASLWPFERRVAALVAAHPDPVPVAWVAEFADVDTSAVLSIVTGAAKRLLTSSADHVSPASVAVRDALRAGCDPTQMRQAHEFLAQQLTRLERTISVDRTLAHHLEQLGRVRDAARVHLRLLHAYWAIRPRERPYELIEGICRSGLELLEAHGSTIPASTRRHLFCFYLKQWINAFWARNLFTKAKPVIDEWAKRLGETMPASVAPRYVRSVLEREGAKNALSLTSVVSQWYTKSGAQLKARLGLESALCMHMMGAYQESLNCLKSLPNRDRFGARDQYRHVVYSIMSQDEVAGTDSQFAMDRIAEAAESANCVDESLLIRALDARKRIAAGTPAVALRQIALGCRVARRNRLYGRQNLLYRLAAGAYSDMGDTRRVRTYQERALQTAGEIGAKYFVATSWSRLAMNERMAGRFGNALRYGEYALQLIGGEGPERDLSQVYLSIYAAHVVLGRGGAHARAVAQNASSAQAPNDQGYYLSWRGRELLFENRPDEALHAFRSARRCFEKAAFPYNAAWAALLEARVHLSRYDRHSLDLCLSDVSKYLSGDLPLGIQLDLQIVKLSKAYIFRTGRAELLDECRRCERAVDSEPDASLKVEALRGLFRAYARAGCLEDADRVLNGLLDLVRGMISNVDERSAEWIAEKIELQTVLDEQKVIARPRNSERDPSGSPSFPD